MGACFGSDRTLQNRGKLHFSLGRPILKLLLAESRDYLHPYEKAPLQPANGRGMTGALGLQRPNPSQFDSLNDALKRAAGRVDLTLDEVLPQPVGPSARVAEAMRYAVFAGGKRIRPFLTLASAGLFDVSLDHSLRVAAAIEALHTYSLVHDDLPCMDDDDLRDAGGPRPIASLTRRRRCLPATHC